MLTKLPTQLNWNNRLSFTFGALTEFLKAFNREEINWLLLNKTDLFLYWIKPFKKTLKSFSKTI